MRFDLSLVAAEKSPELSQQKHSFAAATATAYVARVAKLNVILDRTRLEDFTVISERRSLTEVAHEMLVKAGWISKLMTHYEGNSEIPLPAYR